MTYTPPTTAGLSAESYTSPAQSGRIASPSGQPLRVMPLMRTYEVAHLTTSLTIEENIVIAPALPVFETAFAAFGRGAILRTENGPMAVEDLLHGDRVMTAESAVSDADVARCDHIASCSQRSAVAWCDDTDYH